MQRRSIAIVSIVSTALVTTAAALELREFVAGWPIETPANAEVFDIPLTAEIYAAANELGQLAVLDANGVPQSFFRRGVPSATATEQRVTLEASPLYAERGDAVPTVGVTTSERGTAVTVTAGGQPEPALTGFVLDARAVTTAPIALELQWRALPQPFLLDVRVEHSDNLTTWRGVGTAAVASLAIGDTEVRHIRVPIRASAGGYLRVSALRSIDGWYLERAVLVSSTAEAIEPLLVTLTSLDASAVAAAAGDAVDVDSEAQYFDAGGAVPVTALSFDFSAAAGWLRADVASAASLAGPWRPVTNSQLFYALEFEGYELESEPFDVARIESRYWRVRPATPPRGAAPRLVLEVPPESLRVAANGSAPYLLAAGTLNDEAGPDPTFASVWSALGQRDMPAVPAAALGSRRELGGSAALVAVQPFPWRTMALWIVLIGGVLVVGFMAVRLAREIQSKPS